MKEQNHLGKVLTTTLIVLLVTAGVTAAMGKNIFVDIYTWIAKPFQQTAVAMNEGGSSGKTRDELIEENKIYEYIKKSRFAAEVFTDDMDAVFPFNAGMLKLLRHANPLKQSYYYIEDDRMIKKLSKLD